MYKTARFSRAGERGSPAAGRSPEYLNNLGGEPPARISNNIVPGEPSLSFFNGASMVFLNLDQGRSYFPGMQGICEFVGRGEGGLLNNLQVTFERSYFYRAE